MDKPTPKERVEHVMEAIKSIRQFVNGASEDIFSEDVKLQSAVLYQFLIIGEAIRHIDDTILHKHPYPWHIPRSFRNFIIHEYHGIKMERIYHASNDMEELEQVMKQILRNEF